MKHFAIFLCTFQKQSSRGVLQKTWTLLKKSLRHKCFSCEFFEISKTPFFIEHLRWLLLAFLIIYFTVSVGIDTRDNVLNECYFLKKVIRINYKLCSLSYLGNYTTYFIVQRILLLFLQVLQLHHLKPMAHFYTLWNHSLLMIAGHMNWNSLKCFKPTKKQTKSELMYLWYVQILKNIAFFPKGSHKLKILHDP